MAKKGEVLRADIVNEVLNADVKFFTILFDGESYRGGNGVF